MAKDMQYDVTVLGWEKHNIKLKKSFEYFMFSRNFFYDSKINQCSTAAVLMYIYLLTRCATECKPCINLSATTVLSVIKQRRNCCRTLLSELEENQLVSVAPSKNRIEKNRIEKEEKRREKNLYLKGEQENQQKVEDEKPKQKKSATQPSQAPAPIVENSGTVISKYCDAWKARYKSDKSPAILPQHAKSIKTLVLQVGVERAIQFVESYLSMPDAWFVTKRHDIPTLMANLNAVTQFVETGRMFTKSEIQNLDHSTVNQKTLEALRSGKI